MNKPTRDPQELLPLTQPVFSILLALAGGEKHGYGLMQEITAQTNGRLSMGPGTLYGSIKRMTEDGLIAESEARPDPDHDDVRRRYYQMTDFGRQVATAEATRMEHLVQLAVNRRLLPSAEGGGQS